MEIMASLQGVYMEIVASLHGDCGEFTWGLWRVHIGIMASLEWFYLHTETSLNTL
jgi:hypothetical protein